MCFSHLNAFRSAAFWNYPRGDHTPVCHCSLDIGIRQCALDADDAVKETGSISTFELVAGRFTGCCFLALKTVSYVNGWLVFIYLFFHIFVLFCFLFPCSGTSSDEMCNLYIMYYMEAKHAVSFMTCTQNVAADLFRTIPAEANIPIPVKPDLVMMHGHHRGEVRAAPAAVPFSASRCYVSHLTVCLIFNPVFILLGCWSS